jgi:hypothetical protein
MSKEPPEVVSRFLFADGENDKTIAEMAERAVIEVGIAGEESRLRELVKERNDLLRVIHSFPSQIMPDLLKGDLPDV